MRKVFLFVGVFLVSGTVCWAQSALDGTTFKASIFNLPDSVGVTRIADGASECRSEARTPVGNDVPLDPDACLSFDAGTAPVDVVFNADPVALGGGLFEATSVPYDGSSTDPIETFNFVQDQTIELTTYQTSGDLIEFTFRTPDNTFPASDEFDFWGFSATGIQYPNAKADSEVGQFYEEAVGNYVNSYFWFETAEGTATDGYQIQLPTGIGVGRHPTDANREVVYPFFSQSQQDSLSDTVPGGSLDYHSHGSILDGNPEIGNLLFLADGTWVDGTEVTGFGIGLLVQPPELDEAFEPADVDRDGMVDAIDIDLLSLNLREGTNLASSDLNGDGSADLRRPRLLGRDSAEYLLRRC